MYELAVPSTMKIEALVEEGAPPVAQSGRVLLFVNDTDVGNNTGAFNVRVTVMPPR